MNVTESLNVPRFTKNEVARDLIALGGLPFYFLVLVRATIGSYHEFLSQVAIALPALYVLSIFVKGSNLHIARGLVLVVFTSIFYEALPFTVFSALVWACMILSLIYLKVAKGEIIRGIVIGATSVAIGYSLTLLIVPG